MTADRPQSSDMDPPRALLWPGAVIVALIAACCLVELTLMAADAGWLGSTRWRGLAYQNGAFWAGLLYDWRPNYSGQPVVMFASYAFLHGGFGHLLGNMVTLFALGAFVRDRVGTWGFVAIYVLSTIGGAAGFALLTTSPQPMVGASGALFGLAGALVYGDWVDRRAEGRRLWPVGGMIAFLIALNLGMWVMLDGVLAWQTHLAGFIAGGLVAAMLTLRQ